MAGNERRARYWRANLRILVILLSIWFGVSFGLGILLVEPLNRIHIGGFPLGFWFAQQGLANVQRFGEPDVIVHDVSNAFSSHAHDSEVFQDLVLNLSWEPRVNQDISQ